jgi:hypothetical protein
MPDPLITALEELSRNSVITLNRTINGSNGMNSRGEIFEEFIKNCFCGCLTQNISKRKLLRAKILSYEGSSTKPPDIMIRGGPAIEVKKLESTNAGEIQLNSSPPRSIVRVNDPRITEACRRAESWKEKNVLYCVGYVEKIKLVAVTIIDGKCYAADPEVYDQIAKLIAKELKAIGSELVETKELGRVNGVDSTRRTNLRIRGMWLLEAPLKAFKEYLHYERKKQELQVFCLLTKENYGHLKLEKLNGYTIDEIQLKDPNNAIKKLDVIRIVR